MKKGTIIALSVIGVIVVLLISLVAWAIGSYNDIVNLEMNVDEKTAAVDTMLTRRADLIPNLVNTVKGYAAHEEQIYTDIANARAALVGSSSTTDKLEANDQLSSALSRLLVVVENYPELAASEQFIALQDQLEGTENRIATARTDYNKAVKEYNAKIRRFPASIIAGMFGFESEDMYEAPDSAETAPTVNF